MYASNLKRKCSRSCVTCTCTFYASRFVVNFDILTSLLKLKMSGKGKMAEAKAAAYSSYPKAFVFDLDNCTWDPEMYQMRQGSPFSYD